MSAKSIFKNIIDAGWPGVRVWEAEKTEETLHLEFKAKDRESASMSDKDWGAIAQALSAFANSDGGVYVLGVHAINPGKNLPDEVRSIIPLPNLGSFRGAVQRRIYELTDPPIAGVVVESVEDPDAPGFGIVVIYVPQSEAMPHRAIVGAAAIRERYYMRSTASTIPMHHALLAEKFGRRPMAQLYLMVQYSLSRLRCSAEVWIGNSGRGYAERPAVSFVQDPDPAQPDPDPGFWWHLFKPAKGWDFVVRSAAAKDGVGCIVRASADTVLYPGMEMLLGFAEDDQMIGGRSSFRLSIHGKLYALNAQPMQFGLMRELPIEGSDVGRRQGRIEVPIISPSELA